MTTTSDIRTQFDIMLPAAIREQVRQAGHDPDSPSGERLVQWATAQAAEHFDEILTLDINHQGAMIHKKMIHYTSLVDAS